MVYKDKEQEKLTVNQAWDHLYQRLEKDGLLPEKAIGKPPRRYLSVATILSAAAAITVCIYMGWHYTHKTIQQDETMLVMYNEANAPTLATMLEDGSVVYLAEQSSLKYPDRFAEDKREVILQGEAFFEVKKQTERPFIIDTDIAKVEVTGTSFKIKSGSDASFLLSVNTGEVLVTQKSSQQTLSVKAGETILFDAQQIQLNKSDAGFDEFFTYIHFKDERLADVAAIINLHSDTIQLKVDPAIADRIITFPFIVSSNIVETTELIGQALNLRLLQQGNNLYITKPE
jgi:ferric-dicitrate binding protein FerR (iron transport regulator)